MIVHSSLFFVVSLRPSLIRRDRLLSSLHPATLLRLIIYSKEMKQFVYLTVAKDNGRKQKLMNSSRSPSLWESKPVTNTGRIFLLHFFTAVLYN